jgi:foldase protein PrsA
MLATRPQTGRGLPREDDRFMNRKQCHTLLLLLAAVALLASGCGATATPLLTAQPTGPAPLPLQAVQPTAVSPAAKIEEALKHIQRMEGAVLARVNGQEITWDDYEATLRQSLFSISQQYDIDWADPAMQQRLWQLQNDVLEQAADRILLRQMAEEQGIAVDQAQLQATIDKEKSGIIDSGRYADWAAFLEANGLTDATFGQLIADTLLLNALFAAQDVDTQAEQVHIRHIVVTDQAVVDEIVAKLKAGGDFAALAAEYSADTETKDNGGDLGWFTPETIISELKEAALSLPLGGFSDPIRTRAGYTIIQVVERGPHELEATVMKQRQQQALQAQLETLKSTAVIDYLVDFTATPAP